MKLWKVLLATLLVVMMAGSALALGLSTAPVAKHEGCLKPETCTGKRLLETEKNGKLEVVWACGKVTYEEIPAEPVEPKHEGCLKPETCTGKRLLETEKNGKLEVVWECGKLTFEEIPEEPAHKCFAETKAVANKDGLSHAISCVCGEFWKNEAHTYEEGVCTVCGFESPIEQKPVEKHPGCLKPETCTGKRLLETVKNGKLEVVWECGKLTWEEIPADEGCTFGQHDWCIEAGIPCPICGECGHTWADGVCKWCGEKSPFEVAPECKHENAHFKQIISDPTCTEDGYIIQGEKYCDKCEKFIGLSQIFTKGLEARGHKWVDGVCTVCGEKSPFEVAPDTHKCMAETKYVHNIDGKTHDIVCAECGKVWKNEVHNWETLVEGEWFCLDCGKFTTNDPTHKCMAETKYVHNIDGKTHDIVCVECGKVWKNEAHNWETLVEGEWFCLDCGKFTTEIPIVIIPIAPDHKCMAETKYVHNIDGVSHDIVCAECGKLWKNEAHNWETLVEGEWFCLDCGKFTTNDPTHKCMSEIKYVHNKDGKTHDIICAECGKFWKNEAHDWFTYGIMTTLGEEWFCLDCGKVEYRAVVKTKMYYNNTMTSFGPTTRELVGGNDWYRVTPVDLSVDGVYTYDLVASNKYIVGTVTITVNAGALTVEYKTMSDVVVKDEALLVYASKADLAEGKAVTAAVGAAINTAETFGEDTKVLVSLILTGDYDAMGKSVINEAAAAALVANID